MGNVDKLSILTWKIWNILIKYEFEGGKCAPELAGVHSGQPQVPHKSVTNVLRCLNHIGCLVMQLAMPTFA